MPKIISDSNEQQSDIKMQIWFTFFHYMGCKCDINSITKFIDSYNLL